MNEGNRFNSDYFVNLPISAALGVASSSASSISMRGDSSPEGGDSQEAPYKFSDTSNSGYTSGNSAIDPCSDVLTNNEGNVLIESRDPMDGICRVSVNVNDVNAESNVNNDQPCCSETFANSSELEAVSKNTKQEISTSKLKVEESCSGRRSNRKTVKPSKLQDYVWGPEWSDEFLSLSDSE